MTALRRIAHALHRHAATRFLLGHLGLAMWHLRRAIVRRREQVSPDADQLIHPRPRDIRRGLWRLDLLRSLNLRRQRDLVGLVRGGDWDLRDYPLAELGIFEAIRQRFEDGVPWEQIPYFDEIRRSLDSGRPQFKYRGVEDIPRQWRRIDDLHEQIRSHGFRSQKDLASRRPWDEISVAVDRHGRLLFLDGRHRLAIARVLGCLQVPALVGLRHRRWEELRHEVGNLAETSFGRLLLPAHPDLPHAPWPPVRDSALASMLPHVPAPPGPVVDLETGFGYWCQQMEAEGYETFALSSLTDQRLERLRLGCEIETRILDEPPAERDFALALALGGGESRLWDRPEETLRRCLSSLRVRSLVLHLPTTGADAATAAAAPAFLGSVLGLTAIRELTPDSRGGRLLALSEGRKR